MHRSAAMLITSDGTAPPGPGESRTGRGAWGSGRYEIPVGLGHCLLPGLDVAHDQAHRPLGCGCGADDELLVVLEHAEPAAQVADAVLEVGLDAGLGREERGT